MSINQSLTRAVSLIAVITTVQILLQLPYLPSPLAVRFNWAGDAVGWNAPHSFAIVNLVIVAVIVGIALALPSLMARRRRLRWRLPNRDYWLAPERIPETLEYLKRQFLWHGVVTLLLLMGVFQLVVDANSREPATLDTSRLLLFVAGYFAFIVLWSWALWRKFSRPPPDRRENPFA